MLYVGGKVEEKRRDQVWLITGQRYMDRYHP